MNWFSKLLRKKFVRAETPTISSIQFDTSAWKLQKRSKRNIFWVNDDGDALSLHLVNNLSGLPAFSDLIGLRSFCRQLATGDGKVGGIVSVDVIEMQGIPALKTIYKYEKRPAYGYTGMVIFPLKSVHYVVTIASGERGVTGVRDAFVTAQLADEGKLEIEEFEKPDTSGSIGRIKGWFQDPYDSAYEGYILCSTSDDEKYDILFPDHPLSKIRKHLMHIEGTLKYDEPIAGIS